MTTRAQRPGECRRLLNYFFRTREEFEELIRQGQMLEYAEYVGNYYGTPLTYVNEPLIRESTSSLKLKYKGLSRSRKKFQMQSLSF